MSSILFFLRRLSTTKSPGQNSWLSRCWMGMRSFDRIPFSTRPSFHITSAVVLVETTSTATLYKKKHGSASASLPGSICSVQLDTAFVNNRILTGEGIVASGTQRLVESRALSSSASVGARCSPACWDQRELEATLVTSASLLSW